MGTPPSLSTMFSKGDNFCDFLFAYLVRHLGRLHLPEMGSSLKGKNLLQWSKFFPLRDDPNLYGKTELFPLKVDPFIFKVFL